MYQKSKREMFSQKSKREMFSRKLERVRKNYIILREYIKSVLPPLTEIVDPTMNLISMIHDFCERREYAFNVLSEYSIIT